MWKKNPKNHQQTNKFDEKKKFAVQKKSCGKFVQIKAIRKT